MDDSQKFTYIVGPEGCFVMKYLSAACHVDALVFHYTRVAAAGGIDGNGVKYWRWTLGVRSNLCDAVFVGDKYRLAFGLSFDDRSSHFRTDA